MYYNQRQFYFSRAENMQKLSRIKSPALKRAVIGLGLITAFGAGYRLNEAKWQQLAKEPEKKVRELSPAAFRMDEYTPEGVKIADLAAIDALPFRNPDSAKFAALRLDSLTVDSLQSIARYRNEKGRLLADALSFGAIEKRKNKLVQELDTVYSEDFLKTGKEYYKLVCLEIYKCGRYGENRDLWAKSDDELRREVNFGQSLMKVKMGVLKKMQRRSAYPLKEFERDFRRTRMAQSLLQERRMRRENNNAVACLAAASEREQRAAFETRKDSLRRSLYEKAAAERRAGLDSLLHPFKYMPQTLWNGASR